MLKPTLAVLAILTVLPYGCGPVYRFGAVRPFAGSHFYNPYGSLHPTWRRSNLHAHSRVWFGITAARQSNAEVADAYRTRGYDVAAVSNYQHLSASPDGGGLAVYEHGFNLGKRHQLAIGARRVSWFDLPLWQGVHQKQYVIDRVGEAADLVAIAHPAALGGFAYSDRDLQQLAGYQLLEVVNSRFAVEGRWDAALSAGRAVWAIANDDTHDVSRPDRFAVAWNMIDAPSSTAPDITSALRAGRTYAVMSIRTSPEPEPEPVLSSVEMQDGSLIVTCSGPLATFVFVGQDGAVRKTVKHATTASYRFTADDPYIRTVVRTDERTLYLNPVIRYDGQSVPLRSATIDPWRTWTQRIGILGWCGVVLVWGFRPGTIRRAGRRMMRWTALTRAAAWTMVAIASVAAPARGQDAPTPRTDSAVADGVSLGATFDADVLNALPTGDSVFSLLETGQAEAISDRIAGGGLGFGHAARLSAFGSSWTQTHYRVGDVNITDPSTGGTPLALPELFFWQRVSVQTGLISPDVSTPGMTVTFEPRSPSPKWTTTVEGSSSFGDAFTATPATPAPPIARPAGWNRGSVLASGPVSSGRAGLVVGAAWTGTSELDRNDPLAADSGVASVFAHLLAAASTSDEISTVGWVQHALFPAIHREVFVSAQPRLADTSLHVQSTWSHGGQARTPWRVFAAYEQRHRSPPPVLSGTATIERLLDGPPSEQLVDTGARTDRRVSAGVRADRVAGLAGPHKLQVGIDIDAARSSADPGFTGVIAERVDGLQSRLWQYDAPLLTSHRHSNTLSGFARDQLAVGTRATFDLALRYEWLGASAEGASQGITWSTFLPRGAFRWRLSEKRAVAFFAGIGRSAYQLPLDDLAWGDPVAPSADVFRWTAPAPTPLARLFPAGPGSVGRIDPNLQRPLSNDLVLGIEARPLSGLKLQLAGVGKWEKQLLAVVNRASPGPAYSIVNVSDPGLLLEQPSDDQVLHVASLVLPTTASQFDDVLTNQADATARRLGMKLTVELTRGPLWVLVTGTADQAEGVAAGRAFGSSENDQGVLGDVGLDPNGAPFSSGRLFGDRAFTGKVSATYRFPRRITLGAIARYQDGQPFARLVLVPDLNQGPDLVRAFPNGLSRFTFTGTLDVRLQKEFTAAGHTIAAFVDVFNLTNLAEEVEERVVTGATFRAPTVMQPPRTLHLGARVSF